MKPRPLNRAKVHLILACILLLATLNLLATSRSQNVCTALKSAHRNLLNTIHNLPHNVTKPDVATSKPSHDLFRTASTAFLSISALPQARHCRPLRPRRSKLEFPILRSNLEPVLLYLLSVTGATKKTIVVFDSAASGGHLAGGVQAVLHGWRVVAICSKWTGFEATRKYYDGLNGNIAVIDASSSAGRARWRTSRAGRLETFTAREGIAGVIDALILFPSRGEELQVLRRIRESALRPRMIAMYFQAYWGGASHVRTGDGMVDDEGRERFFVGASLPALVALANRVDYRLVWCMISHPIAFLVDARADVAAGLLGDIDIEKCFGGGLIWRRDAEAMWDLAQEYEWDTAT